MSTPVQTPNQKQEEKKQVVTFSFLQKHYEILFAIWAAKIGSDSLKKLSATKATKAFESFLRAMITKGAVGIRNQNLTRDYTRSREQVDSLVEDGMSREDAEQEVFECSIVAARRKLQVSKKAPLF